MKFLKSLFFYLGLFIIIIPTVFVFYWMISGGFKTQLQIISSPPVFFFEPNIKNYIEVITQHNFGLYMWNSFVVAALSTLVALLVGIPAGYSISRFRMRTSVFLLTVSRMVPFVSYLMPWFITFRRWGLIDSYTGLTLAHLIVNMPIVDLLMSTFFEEVPYELEEAAEIDGASKVNVFKYVSLPLARNGVITSAILSFVFSWNQFLFSLILSGPRTQTVPIAVFNFMTYEEIAWGGLLAAATMITLPVLILTIFIHKYIVRGLTLGALKG